MKHICIGMLVGLFLIHCGSDDEGGAKPAGGTGGNGGASGQAGQGGEAGSGGSVETGGSSTGGSSVGGSAGTAGGGTVCDKRCEKTAELGCPNDAACVVLCQAAIDYAPWCSDIMTSFVSCSEARPISDWSCDASGHSALSASACQNEAQAGVSCLAMGPPGGMPDLTAECQATCQAMSSLPCAPKDCVSTCVDKIAHGPCAGAVGLVTVCGAKLTAADYQCVQNAPVPQDGKCSAEINLLAKCLQAHGG